MKQLELKFAGKSAELAALLEKLEKDALADSTEPATQGSAPPAKRAAAVGIWTTSPSRR